MDVHPDHIVCIGDFGSFDSLSTHHTPGDATDHSLPCFDDELTAVEDAQETFFMESGEIIMCPSTMIMGNHEERWERFAKKYPKILPTERLRDVYSPIWDNIYNYKEWVTIDGITYTHIPHTIMGKPIGGVNATRSVAMGSTRSVIFGHTHTMNVSNVPFIDGRGSRCAMSAPAFMPDGHIEPYAKDLPTGWTYGCLLVHPQGERRPFSYEYISMKDLEDEYSM